MSFMVDSVESWADLLALVLPATSLTRKFVSHQPSLVSATILISRDVSEISKKTHKSCPHIYHHEVMPLHDVEDTDCICIISWLVFEIMVQRGECLTSSKKCLTCEGSAFSIGCLIVSRISERLLPLVRADVTCRLVLFQAE